MAEEALEVLAMRWLCISPWSDVNKAGSLVLRGHLGVAPLSRRVSMLSPRRSLKWGPKKTDKKPIPYQSEVPVYNTLIIPSDRPYPCKRRLSTMLQEEAYLLEQATRLPPAHIPRSARLAQSETWQISKSCSRVAPQPLCWVCVRLRHLDTRSSWIPNTADAANESSA